MRTLLVWTFGLVVDTAGDPIGDVFADAAAEGGEVEPSRRPRSQQEVNKSG